MTNVEWLRSRLLPHEAYLLSSEEEAKFRGLVEGDDVCRRLYEQFLSTRLQDPEPLEHISSYRIARWPRFVQTVRGMERDLVRKHLENCEECKSDLMAFGFEPVVAIVPGLESSSASAFTPVRPPTAGSERHPLTSIAQFFRELSVPNRWTLGWAVAATVAIPLLLLREGPSQFVAARVGSAMLVRGGDSDRFAAMTSADRRSLVVIVAPLPTIGDHERVDVALVGPDGKVVASTMDQRVADVVSPQALILSSKAPLEAGEYSIRVTPRDRPDEFVDVPLRVAVP